MSILDSIHMASVKVAAVKMAEKDVEEATKPKVPQQQAQPKQQAAPKPLSNYDKAKSLGAVYRTTDNLARPKRWGYGPQSAGVALGAGGGLPIPALNTTDSVFDTRNVLTGEMLRHQMNVNDDAMAAAYGMHGLDAPNGYYAGLVHADATDGRRGQYRNTLLNQGLE